MLSDLWCPQCWKEVVVERRCIRCLGPGQIDEKLTQDGINTLLQMTDLADCLHLVAYLQRRKTKKSLRQLFLPF